VHSREDFRKISVFDGLPSRLGAVSGKGPDGYRDALELVRGELAG
jgi:3-dehydroquinate dehydratase